MFLKCFGQFYCCSSGIVFPAQYGMYMKSGTTDRQVDPEQFQLALLYQWQC